MNWYLKFIGISNKGFKRIWIILMIGWVVFWVSEFYWIRENEFLLRNEGKYNDGLNYVELWFVYGLIGIHLVMRIIRWVIDGFKKE